jgi:hypothetical protein
VKIMADELKVQDSDEEPKEAPEGESEEEDAE